MQEMKAIAPTVLEHGNTYSPVEIESSGDDNDYLMLTMNRGEHEEGIVILGIVEVADLMRRAGAWLASLMLAENEEVAGLDYMPMVVDIDADTITRLIPLTDADNGYVGGEDGTLRAVVSRAAAVGGAAFWRGTESVEFGAALANLVDPDRVGE